MERDHRGKSVVESVWDDIVDLYNFENIMRSEGDQKGDQE